MYCPFLSGSGHQYRRLVRRCRYLYASGLHIGSTVGIAVMMGCAPLSKAADVIGDPVRARGQDATPQTGSPPCDATVHGDTDPCPAPSSDARLP